MFPAYDVLRDFFPSITWFLFFMELDVLLYPRQEYLKTDTQGGAIGMRIKSVRLRQECPSIKKKSPTLHSL